MFRFSLESGAAISAQVNDRAKSQKQNISTKSFSVTSLEKTVDSNVCVTHKMVGVDPRYLQKGPYNKGTRKRSSRNGMRMYVCQRKLEMKKGCFLWGMYHTRLET